MLTDERIGFALSAYSLEEKWKKLTSQKHPTPHVWTDAYLAAFAHSAEMRLVTLDRAVRTLDPEALILH
jgi:predicted nucleic acid-binding protein